MSRLQLASLGAGVAQTPSGAVAAGRAGTVTYHDGSGPVPIYPTETGGSADTSGNFVTDSLGRIPGWVAAGPEVDITIPPAATVTTLLGGITVAPAAVPPTIATIGASIEFNEGSDNPIGSTPPAVAFANGLGVIQWANAFSDGKLRLVKNAAQSGQTSAQMLANMQNQSNSQWALGINPTPGFFYLGNVCGDDPGTLTPAQSAANWTAIYNLLRTTYPQTIIIVVTLPGVNIPNGTGNWATRAVLNPVIRAAAQTNPMTVLFDMEGLYTNPLTGLPVAALSQDQIHPNPGGGSTLGQALAKLMAPYLTGSSGFVNDYFSDSRVQSAQGGWGTQAMFTGAGPVGAGWTSLGLTGQVNSLVARSDQYGNWQKCAYGGTAGAIGVYRAFGALPAGAQIYAEQEVQFQGNLATGTITDLSLGVSTNVGGACNANALGNTLGTQGPFIDPGSGVVICMRTPPVTIPSGGITGGFVVPQISGTATSGSIAFGRCSLVRQA